VRAVLLIFIGVLLVGCQTNRIGLYNTAPMVAFDRSEIREVASRGAAFSYVKGRPIDVSQYPFFTENSFGRDWLSRPKNRVITIGYPKECATYNSRWGHGQLSQAVEVAMLFCLSRVKELSHHTGKKCGCRVAAINNNILLSPDDLPFRKNLPAIALVKDEKGRKEILGYAKTTGRTGKNQPFDFFTQSDRPVCTGSYNLGTVSFEGNAQLDCFQGRIKGPALFKVAGFREGQAYGTALVKAGENELILVYGLPTEEFRKRRAELIDE
jgi:hypothetical protein